MSCTGTPGCLCGACAGTHVVTPAPVTNLPGLPAIARRIGTWSSFKESFLARLSSSDYPALAQLKARSDDDFTVAFLDASAVVLDVLTFYQERLSNESYLRTAAQLRSLTELSRLIGYSPAPGVAASTYLAFTLKAASGQPANPSTKPITIPAGSQVQSVPAQGQSPQTFETSADILAKADWNELPVQTIQRWVPASGDRSMYLAGTATQLNPGDAILIVGEERASQNPASENWDVRIVVTVTVDGPNKRTLITWNEGLGAHGVSPAQVVPRVYALRQKASLFGYNAIDPNLLNTTNSAIGEELTSNDASPPSFTWAGYGLGATLDLDAVYPKIVQGGWVVLVAPGTFDSKRSISGLVSLYQVSSVSAVSRSAFGMSAKISRVAPDVAPSASDNPLASTLALAQSEELPAADQPITYPLYGTVLDLQDLRPDLVATSVAAVSGNRQKLAVADGVTGLLFYPDDHSEPAGHALQPGDILTVTAPTNLPLPFPVPDAATGRLGPWDLVTGASSISTLYLEDENGRTGTIVGASLSQFELSPSLASDPVVSEYALVSSAGPSNSPYAHTQFQLTNPLTYCYDRLTTTVNANVGLATAGRTVSEIMGSGSASTPNQSFTLKQAPLTFVQTAATPTGRVSTLQVQVNAVSWMEEPFLYGQGPAAPVFATLNQTAGATEVMFGDGVEGSVLPTGANNLQATYRVGSGSAGNVGPGTITTLMDRPLGVSGVSNPEAATGGQDAQSVDDIRASAPLTVLTLGRAVSILDYQNYALNFSGISKAYALWIPSGPGRGVFLTVAGVDGVVLPAGCSTLTDLFGSLQNYGNPLIPITVCSYVETLFQFSANLVYDPTHDAPTVQAAAFAAVTALFSFASRDFGQSVTADALAAAIQDVDGVVAVNITGLWRTTSSTGGDISGAGGLSVAQWNSWLAGATQLPRLFPDTPTQLYAYLPVASVLAPPFPAEILVLDPAMTAASWGVMT